MNPSTILIVEDDAKIADMIGNYLRANSYTTFHVADGGLAIKAFQEHKPDLVLLDLMLPTMDGLDVCKKLRQISSVPIIMVTARVEEIDRLLGLEIGADDYLCKPFSPRELMARIKAILRRAQGQLDQAIESKGSGQFVIYADENRLTWAGRTVPLTGVEFRIFHLLYSKEGHVLNRAKLLEALPRGDSRDNNERVIDSHIKNMRKKLDAAGSPVDCISSVYGSGYRYEMPE
jgi:two-component system, OmpR family, response regulator BaeR